MSEIVLCTINAKWIHPSLALRLLKANLPGCLNVGEHGCKILEFALRQPLAEKTAAVLAEAPKILAFSVSIWNHNATLELIQALETGWGALKERPVVVLGGPELTPLPPDTEIFRHADFVIRGEGELCFAELCSGILHNLGAARNKYGRFLEGGIADTKTIKSAYDFYTEEDLRHKLIYVESSRGCPCHCAFCQSANNDPVRDFPLGPFLDDLGKLLLRCGGKTRTIKFLDRSFNAKPERAAEILKFCLGKIKNFCGPGDGSPQFHFEMIPSGFTRELLELLALFPPGTIRLEIGIQSFNPETNRLIRRASDPEKELELIDFLRDTTNAILHADLIAGLPGEGYDSFGRGFDRLWAAFGGSKKNSGAEKSGAAPFEIQPGILKCLPGTQIYEMAEKKEFKVSYNKTAPYEVTGTDCLPGHEMDKIKNFARFWELIVNRGLLPELSPVFAPAGVPVFERFMDVSQKLYGSFGKNWGIPKDQLEAALIKLQAQ